MTTKRTAAGADTIAALLNPDSKGFVTSLKEAICNLCNGPATSFTNDLSRREYNISAMCQVCQDFAFGPSTVDPDDTIESVFGDYTEEEIDATYDEYDADQQASR